MKILAKYEYFEKNIYYNIMWNRRIKNNLSAGTPTLIINHVDFKNSLKRIYHKDGVCNAHCRVCDTLLISPNINYLAKYRKYVYCSSCGYRHNSDNIMQSNLENRIFPLHLKIKLVEMKNGNIELVLSYIGEKLGKDVYHDFKENISVIEKFIFNFNANAVTWTYKSGICTEELAIGYFTDLENFNDKTILQYIPYNLFDKNGQKISKLIKILRDKINYKFQCVGMKKKKLYIAGTKSKLVLDSILYLAHKIRFWDNECLKEFYGKDRYNSRELLNYFKKTNCELRIEEYIKEYGDTYINAFIKHFGLPNTKLVRINSTYSNVKYLKQAYSLKNIDLGNMCYKYLKEEKISYDNIKVYYDKISKYYPNVKDSIIVKFFRDEINSSDTIRLWKMLDIISLEKFEEKIPKFSELHDYLSLLVTEQEDREQIYNIPIEILNRFELELKNTKYEVLKKFSSLKKVGMDLHNCAVSYRNKVNDELQLVAVTDERGKTICLLRIEKFSLKEAKLLNNIPVKKNIKYNNLVLEFIEKAKLKIDTNDIEVYKEKVG